MSVHKRTNNGTHYVSYRDTDGKQKTKTFGKGREGKRDAQKFDEHVKAQKTVDVPMPVATAGQVIYLDHLAQRYIDARKVAGTTLKTLKELKSLLDKHFIVPFAQRPVDEIGFDEILSIMSTAYANRTPVTRGRLMSYLKTMFKFGVDHELISKNPLRLWRKPKEPPRSFNLTVNDLHKIQLVAAPHLAWAIEVAWNLGVRTGESELLALKWSGINWVDRSVNVYGAKTKTNRVIPVSDEFMARLKEMQQKAESDFLIEYEGKPIKQFRRSFQSACKRAGLPYHAIMYDVRHLYATVLLREGGDLSAVSKLMGHSSVHMTANRYYHLMGDEKRRTIGKLPALGGASA